MTQPVLVRQKYPRLLLAFSEPGFRRFWPANFFTYTAQWMQVTLLTWLVLDLTDSAWLVSLVGFFGLAPVPLLGLFGGVLADRVDRRKLITATQTANLVGALVITALLFSGKAQFWHAYLMMLTTGTSFALDFPSRRTLFLDVVGPSRLINSYALDTVGFNVSRMLGPTLAGSLIVITGVKGGFVVVSAMFLTCVALMLSLRVQQGSARVMAGESIRGRLAEGFKYILGSKPVLAVVLVTIIMNLLLFTYVQMVPVIARDTLGVGPALIGLLMAAEGVGALAGAVAIGSVSTIKYHGRLFIGGSALALVCLVLFSLSRWYLVSFPVLVLLGLGGAAFGTMQSAIVMLLAPSEMRGRALGVITLAIGAGPLGALLVGAVSSAASPAFAVGMNAVMGLALLGAVSLLFPVLRQRIVTGEEAAAAPAPAVPSAVPEAASQAPAA